MSFLSLLFFITLCLVPTDGIECIVGGYKGRLSRIGCYDTLCQTEIRQLPPDAITDRFWTWSWEVRCGCEGRNVTGCFYDNGVQDKTEPSTTCCCDEDLCNGPTQKKEGYEALMCWEGNNNMSRGDVDHIFCNRHMLPGKFCSQVISGNNVTAGCGCKKPTRDGDKLDCPCDEIGNGCKDIGGGAKLCCCDRGRCNHPHKPLYRTTRTTTTTTTTSTTSTTASTTTPSPTSQAIKKQDSMIFYAFLLMCSSVLL